MAGADEAQHLFHNVPLSVCVQRVKRQLQCLAVERHGVLALQTLLQALL